MRGKEGKKYQRVIVEDIGWRRTAQTKKSREIILLPAREGWREESKTEKKSKKSFSVVFVLFELSSLRCGKIFSSSLSKFQSTMSQYSIHL